MTLETSGVSRKSYHLFSRHSLIARQSQTGPNENFDFRNHSSTRCSTNRTYDGLEGRRTIPVFNR